MSNLTNITTTVTAMQDNELETMSTELQQLRKENDALKLENQRLNNQLDEQIKLTHRARQGRWRNSAAR